MMTLSTSYRLTAEIKVLGPEDWEFPELCITYGYLHATNDYVVEDIDVLWSAGLDWPRDKWLRIADDYFHTEVGQTKARTLALSGDHDYD